MRLSDIRHHLRGFVQRKWWGFGFRSVSCGGGVCPKMTILSDWSGVKTALVLVLYFNFFCSLLISFLARYKRPPSDSSSALFCATPLKALPTHPDRGRYGPSAPSPWLYSTLVYGQEGSGGKLLVMPGVRHASLPVHDRYKTHNEAWVINHASSVLSWQIRRDASERRDRASVRSTHVR